MERGLARGLEEDAGRGDAALLTRRLTVGGVIGRGRARDMAVNAVLPFMYAYAGHKRSPTLGRTCLRTYRAFPSLADNEITREMKRLLGPESDLAELKGARRHQGLIQLYRGMSGLALDRSPGAADRDADRETPEKLSQRPL